MKPYIVIPILIFFWSNTTCHPIFINIEVQPISCQTNNHNIIVSIIEPSNSDLIFATLEINFGDGVVKDISLDESIESPISNGLLLKQYKIEHTYPGQGRYKISARTFSRSANIVNMKHSVNTPLYVENEILLDPIIGCNTTPHLENYTFPFFKNGQNYNYEFSFIDEDSDSISFHLTKAMQDRETEAVDYQTPVEYEESHIRKISKLSIDPYNGYLLWNTRDIKNAYAMVVFVKEWRKIEGTYYLLSKSTIDYTTWFYETQNTPPEITGLQDTAIIVGNNFIKNIRLSDPENDSLQMLIFGDFARLSDNLPSNGFNYHKGPLDYSLNFQPISQHARSNPYKLIISCADDNDDLALNKTKSMYVWIANRKHQPDPPHNIIAQAYNQNLIGLYWNDAEDELGYIVERADLHFPEFEKIAVLPANTTSFNDSSVVENNTYQYRITSVGTTMSDYVTVEATTPDIVTSMKEDPSVNAIKIYPNPNRGAFIISTRESIQSIKIIDITGKIVFDDTFTYFSNTYEFSSQLNPGIYMIHILDGSGTQQLKLEILN